MNKNIILLFILIFTYTQLWSQVSLNTPNPIHWNATYESIGNDEYILQFSAKIDQGWYLYGQDHDNEFETKFIFEGSDEHVVFLGKQLKEIGKLIKGYDEMLDVNYTKYSNKVAFKQTIRVTQEKSNIVGRVQYMSCDDTQCLPPTEQKFETITIHREEPSQILGEEPMLLSSGIDMDRLNKVQKGREEEVTTDNLSEVLKEGSEKGESLPKTTPPKKTQPLSAHHFAPIKNNVTPAPVPVPKPKPTTNFKPIIKPTKKATPTTIKTTKTTVETTTTPVINSHVDKPELETATMSHEVKTPVAAIVIADEQEDLNHLSPLIFDHEGNVIPDNAVIHAPEVEVEQYANLYVEPTIVMNTVPEPTKKEVVKEKRTVKSKKTVKAVEKKVAATQKVTKIVQKEEKVESKTAIKEVKKEEELLANTIKQIPNRSAKPAPAASKIVDPVHWTFKLQHVANDVYELISTATIEQGWHLYAMNNINQGNGPYPLTFQFDKNTPVIFADQQFVVEGALEKNHDVVFNEIAHQYRNQVTLKRKVKLTDRQTINGSVKFMAANQTNYLLPKKKQFTLQAIPKQTNSSAGFAPSQANYKWFILAGMLLSTLGLGYMVYVYRKNETTIG